MKSVRIFIQFETRLNSVHTFDYTFVVLKALIFVEMCPNFDCCLCILTFFLNFCEP